MSGSFASLSCVLAFMTLVSLFFLAVSIRVVPEEKRLRIYRLGRVIGTRGPGVVVLIPFVDRAVTMAAGAEFQTPQAPAGAQELFGEARTAIYQDGEVVLGDQVWQAISSRPIAAGQRVRMKRVVVEVEEV